MDKYKHDFYVAREEEMKTLFQKGIAIGRPIEKELPMMEAQMGVENHETEYLEDPYYDIEDKEYL